jgi:hypothetical protein
MVKMYAVGNVIRFDYNGKPRVMTIETIKTGYRYLGLVGPVAYLVTGITYDGANHTLSAGLGYRSFRVEKMTNVELVKAAG